MLKFQYYDNVETTFLLYTVITGGSKERQYILKNKNVLENVIHFIVHNSFMFTVAIMGLVHAVLLSVMIYAHVQPLAYFNILSVTIYLFCVLLCKSGQFFPVYLSIFLEVSIYALTSVYYLGWESGSYCFLFSIVPIMLYFGFLLFKGAKRWIMVIVMILIFSEFTFLYIFYKGSKVVYKLEPSIYTILLLFSAFVMFFSIIFYNVLYVSSSESEVNTLEQKNEQLSVDAKEDALTSLLNRRGFLPLVGNLMREKRNFCVAFCDLDNFKRVNDSYGHDGGDEVLRHVSRMLQKEMSGCEICRWGGEEFIILMRDYDFAVAKKKMEYIRKHVESNPTIFYNKRIPSTLTIGLEEYTDKYTEPEEIIKVADERMYYGKQHGKNIVIWEDGETS